MLESLRSEYAGRGLGSVVLVLGDGLSPLDEQGTLGGCISERAGIWGEEGDGLLSPSLLWHNTNQTGQTNRAEQMKGVQVGHCFNQGCAADPRAIHRGTGGGSGWVTFKRQSIEGPAVLLYDGVL